MDDLIVKRYMLIPADRFCYDRGNLVVDFDWNAREIVNRLTDMAPDVLIEAVRTIQLSRSPFVFTDSSKNEVVYNQGEDDEITFHWSPIFILFFVMFAKSLKFQKRLFLKRYGLMVPTLKNPYTMRSIVLMGYYEKTTLTGAFVKSRKLLSFGMKKASAIANAKSVGQQPLRILRTAFLSASVRLENKEIIVSAFST